MRALPPVPWASLAAVKPSAETGSCFDTTRVGTRVAAPGSHTVTPSSASTGGFGAASSTSKPRTDKFLRRGMGTGGTHDAGLASTAARRRASGAAAASSAAPPRAGATRRRANPPTSALRRAYERGDLPVAIMQSVTNKLSWKVKVETLDLAHYLPLFCDGLREVEEPYRFIAEEGVYDLLLRSPLPKVLACVPVIVVPLKTALNTRIPSVIKRVLKILQTLVECGNLIGEALVPFYRQLLPVLAIFKNKKKNLGDAMDYRPDDGIGELIDETLEKLEVTGGPDAFVNIKYLVSWPGGRLRPGSSSRVPSAGRPPRRAAAYACLTPPLPPPAPLAPCASSILRPRRRCPRTRAASTEALRAACNVSLSFRLRVGPRPPKGKRLRAPARLLSRPALIPRHTTPIPT